MFDHLLVSVLFFTPCSLYFDMTQTRLNPSAHCKSKTSPMLIKDTGIAPSAY